MQALTLLALAAILVGCAAIYLASPNQRWLAAPWPARRARVLGVALLSFGWFGLAWHMQALTATFAFVTAVMLVLSVLPYIGALFGVRRGR